jgi:RNA-binding protein 26
MTGIVVEGIPDDKCDEDHVREFFSEFGDIDGITMQPEQKLAIVKYSSHDAAQAAYDSPKVVFDNRFVKVYWHKQAKHAKTSSEAPAVAQESSNELDVVMDDGGDADQRDDFLQHVDEFQRKYQESKVTRELCAEKKQEVSSKLKKIEEERKKMETMIAQRTSGSTLSAANGDADNEQTKALKEQLAQLEAEAKSLGIDTDAPTTNGYNSYNSSYRGRGGYRGRGRGAGRGAYRGFRGGWAGSGGRGGAVMRLDNRPKTVAVTFAAGSYEDHNEAIRQFLLFNSLDSAAVTKHPERDDTALLAFNQRYEGEIFMSALTNSELPHAGKVELSWYKPEEALPIANGTHHADGEKVIISEQASSDGAPEAEEEDLDRY